MKFLITGVTGLIGGNIRSICEEKGYTIHYLTTHRDKIENRPDYKGFFWDPETRQIDKKCLEGVDKIIHLAGANVGQRWTEEHRRNIIASRIKSASLLYSLLKENENQVTQFISASAIGIYPDSISTLYDEFSTEKASDFLGLVVQEWEKAADQFRTMGIGVSKMRIGLVLASKKGLLAELKKTIGNYVGSTLGSGKQWQSWIHVEDVARLFIFIAEEELGGIYNTVAPNPVKQKNLVKCVAKHLNKPLILPPVPKPLLKVVLGNMASMIVSSQLVMNKKLEGSGFIFKYPQLEKAVKDLI